MSSSTGAAVLDHTLSIATRWQTNEAVVPLARPSISVNDSGTRIAIAAWPRVSVKDDSGTVAGWTVREGDSSSGTNALFDERDGIYFVAPPEDPTADYLLVRGDIGDQSLETLCTLPHFGWFELWRRPSIPGILVTARDGQNGSAAMFVADRSPNSAESLFEDHAFDDITPDGDLLVDGGVDVLILGGEDLSEVAVAHTSDLFEGNHPSFVVGTFASPTAVAVWTYYDPRIAIVDPRDGSLIERHNLVDRHGDPVTPVAIAGADGQLLVATSESLYLYSL